MKTKSVLAVLIFLATSLNAQVPEFNWARQLPGDAIILSMTTDQAGNFYATGTFTGTVDFDPGMGIDTLVDAGFGDIFIMKMSSSGILIWAERIGGTSYDQGNSISTDANGNVYVTGFFETDSVDFDPGPGIFLMSGDQNSFVLKLSSNGSFVWAKQLAGLSANYAVSLALDRQNNIFVTGSFGGTADFDPGAGIQNLSSADADIYVWKLDNNGNYIWAKQIASTSIGSRSYSVASDGSGNAYIAGILIGTTDFDPGPATSDITSMSNFNCAFLLKLDATGNFNWAEKIDNTDIGLPNASVQVDSIGNAYLGGSFSGTVDMDPGAGMQNLTAAAGNSHFLLKLDNSGAFAWVKQLPDVQGTALDNAGNIYTCGSSVHRFSSSGMDGWVLDTSLISRLAIDPSGHIYGTGSFSGTVDFDPGTGVYNLTDTSTGTFVMKLDQDSILGIRKLAQSANNISVYPNPARDMFYIRPDVPADYILRNCIGQVVKDISIKGAETLKVDVSKLPAGLYLLSNMYGGDQKVIVQH